MTQEASGHSSLLLEERIQGKFGRGEEAVVVLAESGNPREAMEVQARLRDKLEKAMAAR